MSDPTTGTTDPTGDTLAAIMAPIDIPTGWRDTLIPRTDACRLTVTQLQRIDDILDTIATHPHRWDQNAWMTFVDGAWPVDLDDTRAMDIDGIDTSGWQCTSAFCLAGHTVVATYGDRVRPHFGNRAFASVGGRFRDNPEQVRAIVYVHTFDLLNANGTVAREEWAFDEAATEILGLDAIDWGRRLFSGSNTFRTLVDYRNQIAAGHTGLTHPSHFDMGYRDCLSGCAACAAETPVTTDTAN